MSEGVSTGVGKSMRKSVRADAEANISVRDRRGGGPLDVPAASKTLKKNVIFWSKVASIRAVTAQANRSRRICSGICPGYGVEGTGRGYGVTGWRVEG